MFHRSRWERSIVNRCKSVCINIYIYIYNIYFVIISDNENDVLNALKDGTISILCDDNYNDEELKIHQNADLNEINQSM